MTDLTDREQEALKAELTPRQLAQYLRANIVLAGAALLVREAVTPEEVQGAPAWMAVAYKGAIILGMVEMVPKMVCAAQGATNDAFRQVLGETLDNLDAELVKLLETIATATAGTPSESRAKQMATIHHDLLDELTKQCRSRSIRGLN